MQCPHLPYWLRELLPDFFFPREEALEHHLARRSAPRAHLLNHDAHQPLPFDVRGYARQVLSARSTPLPTIRFNTKSGVSCVDALFYLLYTLPPRQPRKILWPSIV